VRITALRDRRDGGLGWAVVANDVTRLNDQRRELERANTLLRERLQEIELLRADLAEQALRDSLTGLHNRRYLMQTLPGALVRAAAEHTPISVAILDVDHFKQINDRFGHGVGDEVLVRVSGLLAGALRGDDTLVRYGGEEFVVVLPGATGAHARDRIDALRTRLASEVIDAGGHPIPVTFSAGIAVADQDVTMAALLQAADAALYSAKRHGRNRVEVAPSAARPLAA
jgi:diguanylate cyclase (GGDEF)-like protein